jgi:HSP20 family protein
MQTPGNRQRPWLVLTERRGFMNLVKWDPFHDTFFTDWAPAVDVQETPAEYILKADLPEVKKEDVKVEMEDGILTIEGERKQEKEEKGKKFHRVERSYGKFVRRFALPTEVEAGAVGAEFKDGVLVVRLPKVATTRPKSIEVKVA